PSAHGIQHGGLGNSVARRRRRLPTRHYSGPGAYFRCAQGIGRQLRDHALAGDVCGGHSGRPAACPPGTAVVAQTFQGKSPERRGSGSASCWVKYGGRLATDLRRQTSPVQDPNTDVRRPRSEVSLTPPVTIAGEDSRLT